MEIVAVAFNTDFYAVGATVIPVLFIALLMPDGILTRYAVWAKTLRSRQMARIRRRLAREAHRGVERTGETEVEAPEPSTLAVWGVLRIHDLLILPVTAALLLFVMGEISAIHALDHRHASPAEHAWVEAAMVALPILAAISVIVAISFRWSKGIPYSADP